MIPMPPHYHYNRGLMLQSAGAFAQAEEEYRRALELKDDYPPALNNLATLLSRKGLPSHAEELLRRALTLEPSAAHTRNNLGCVLRDQRRHAEACDSFCEALRLAPDYTAAASNLLLTLNYTEPDPAALFEQHHALGPVFERTAKPVPPRSPADPRQRPLRIGYVSPDLRHHPVASFVEAILAHHDRHRFEPYCYADVAVEDETSERLRARAFAWRSIYGRDHTCVAAMIARDEIDILIDLAGHTGPNRLSLFAARPAPVQLTYLGYPATTGLSTIDYRITDDIADPPGAESCCSEKLIRLPRGFLCYTPPPAPPPSEPPVLSTGHITFGSFNTFPKVTDEAIETWSEILRTVPDSRLILKSRVLADDAVRERLTTAFGRYGIAPSRIEPLPATPTHTEHLAAYGRVDIALDTFPYNGTTTTCEALLMGVPVVALAGSTHAGRVGKDLLSRVGLTAMAAGDKAGYVAAAVYLASDPLRLAALRLNLRETLTGSSLCDGYLFARDFEEALAGMV